VLAEGPEVRGEVWLYWLQKSATGAFSMIYTRVKYQIEAKRYHLGGSIQSSKDLLKLCLIRSDFRELALRLS